MADDREIEDKFWTELKGSPFLMLGVEGTRDGATQPMTANFEEQDREAGILWIFTDNKHDLVKALGQSNRAIASYTAKGHDLFASLRGTLTIDNDRATVDRLWNAFIAEWYEGKDDPKLTLLRLDLEDAKACVSVTGGLLTAAINKLFC